MYLVMPAYLAYAGREGAGATHVRFGFFISSSNKATPGKPPNRSRETGIFPNLISHCIVVLGIQLPLHSLPVGLSSLSPQILPYTYIVYPQWDIKCTIHTDNRWLTGTGAGAQCSAWNYCDVSAGGPHHLNTPFKRSCRRRYVRCLKP